MTEQRSRTFPVRQGTVLDGEFTIRIKPESLSELVDKTPPKKIKSDRKFNIRIRQHDILLLDALADQQDVTRSTLINVLLHDFLRDELMSVQDDDARALLALTADEQASYDALAQPWVYDAIGSDCRHLLRSILEFNSPHERMPEPDAPENAFNSETFIGLKSKLKGLKK
ncbi:hypothetical protein MUO32_08535 [Shinella sp. CPCC 101442]|uniref:hypothetical protein n=1 Tax=Shinella sp. CPCC 101442 TaxID=2932265 RepID=UPI0021527CD6|nr:hypothetical protein [Shinella sp. CPCC 101442]MCR6499075.1 hypothetical protein [Shinella sp. CPCC 101442]